MNPLVVLSIARGSTPSPHELENAHALVGAGYRVWVVPHLYHLVAGDPLWARMRDDGAPIAPAVWLHPRPAKWLLAARGIPLGGILDAHNLAAGDTPEALLAWLESVGCRPGEGSVEVLGGETSERWYPVVDRERCTDCGHCLEFCLFGVHSQIDGRIVVAEEDRCKPGCPACSRICPSGAIMFPIYAKDEAIAGAPGTLMSPDADAKRMFYMRTGAACPVCGGTGQFRLTLDSLKGAKCPECGRPAAETRSPVHDEIDALIGKLDQIAKKDR